MFAAFGMRNTEVIHVVELTYPCLTAPRVVLCCVGMYNIECCVRILFVVCCVLPHEKGQLRTSCNPVSGFYNGPLLSRRGSTSRLFMATWLRTRVRAVNTYRWLMSGWRASPSLRPALAWSALADLCACTFTSWCWAGVGWVSWGLGCHGFWPLGCHGRVPEH